MPKQDHLTTAAPAEQIRRRSPRTPKPRRLDSGEDSIPSPTDSKSSEQPKPKEGNTIEGRGADEDEPDPFMSAEITDSSLNLHPSPPPWTFSSQNAHQSPNPSGLRNQIDTNSEGKKRSTTPDIQHFFKKIPSGPTVCVLCNDQYNKTGSNDWPSDRGHIFSVGTKDSSLRNHLMTWHESEYLEQCKNNNRKISEKGPALTRGSGSSEIRPNVPPYSVENLLRAITKFIVVDDQAISVVECPEFRQLLLFLRQDLKDSDIPRRHRVRSFILRVWADHFEWLKIRLGHALGAISLTADIWNDRSHRPFLAITAHWLSRNAENTKLQHENALIAFHLLDGQSGQAIAKVSMDMLDRAGITPRIGHWTLDNARNNDTFLVELQKLMEAHNPPIAFPADDRRIRCLAHIINIIVQHTLSSISKSNPIVDSPEDSQGKFASKDHTDIRIPEDNQTFEDAAARDPVGLARTVVRVLRASNSRRVQFRDYIVANKDKGENFNLEPRELLQDVKSRWDSTYFMIRRFRHLKPAIQGFLSSDRELRNYSLTEKEWDILSGIELILEYAHNVQILMSKEKAPALARAIPALERLMNRWKQMALVNPEYRPWINEGLEWANKYSRYVESTEAHIIALFLHPDFQLTWIKEHWNNIWAEKAEDIVKKTMTTYRTRTGGHDVHPPVTEQFLEETSSLARKFGVEGGLGLNEERLHEEDTVEEELGRYMRSALRSNCKDDILKFWASLKQQENKFEFPTIYRMALDYLPIQATSMPCERIFSSSGETNTKKRNRLHPSLFEALQMLKFGYKRERLNFVEGWVTQESSLTPYTANHKTLASLIRLDREDAFDALLKEIHVYEKDLD